jgi:hypothetical protein
MRKARRGLAHVTWKLYLIARMRPPRFPAEAAQAARHVGLEGDPRLLAVIAYVDAGLYLCRDDLPGRALDLARKRSSLDRLTSLLPDQQVGKRLIARQAADVGRQDAICALEHCGNRLFASLIEACPHRAAKVESQSEKAAHAQ